MSDLDKQRKKARAELAERLDRELVDLGIYAALERRVINEIYILKADSSDRERAELFHKLQIVRGIRDFVNTAIREGEDIAAERQARAKRIA